MTTDDVVERLLETIAEVGGTTALQTLASAAKSKDDQLQDDSSRLLGKWSWRRVSRAKRPGQVSSSDVSLRSDSQMR